MRLTHATVLTGALLFGAGDARADVYQEFSGLRGEAMGGAHRGLASSNDAIFLNPAGMALVKRFSIDGYYGYSGGDDLSHISFSALDSKTGPVAGALAYTHDRGDHSDVNANLHRIYLSSAYALFDLIGIGLTARHIRGDFNDELGQRQNVETYSGDLGLGVILFEMLGIGVTYHNLLSSSRPRLTPPHLGIGLGFSYEGFSAASDLEIDLRRRALGTMTFRLGAEYFLLDMVPLRFGYRYVPTIGPDGQPVWAHVFGGGVGFVTETGSIEATYTHSANDVNDWDLIGALKFFL